MATIFRINNLKPYFSNKLDYFIKLNNTSVTKYSLLHHITKTNSIRFMQPIMSLFLNWYVLLTTTFKRKKIKMKKHKFWKKYKLIKNSNRSNLKKK